MVLAAVYGVLCALLLPVNLGCSFWLFREMLDLSGVTMREVQAHVGPRTRSLGRRKNRHNRRVLMTYLLERSPDPARTQWLFRRYLYSMVPGILAVVLSGFVARTPEPQQLALTGMGLLMACNIGLVLWGQRYRRAHPQDPRTAEALARKRAAMGQGDPLVYVLIAAVAVAVFCGAILMSAAVPVQSVPDFYDFHAALRDRGYETANVPTSYWYVREEALTNVAAGELGDAKVEFYEYTDEAAAREVFGHIHRELTQQEWDHRGPLLRLEACGATTFLCQRGNTLLYAHTATAVEAVEELLEATGYLPKE